jgi:hypothetical protein
LDLPLLVFLFIFSRSEVLVLLCCSCTVAVTSRLISRFVFLSLARDSVSKFRLWIFFYSLLLTRTQHRPVFPFLARSSCRSLCLVSRRWLLCSSRCFAVGSWFAQHKPRPGQRVLLSSVSVTATTLWFGFFAAEAVRAGSFCRLDFSSVERLPNLGIARLPWILFSFGQVFMVKFSSASRQDWTFLCEFCCCFKFFGSCCFSSSCRLKLVYSWATGSKNLRFFSFNRS